MRRARFCSVCCCAFGAALAACGGDVVIKVTDVYEVGDASTSYRRPFAPGELRVFSSPNFEEVELQYQDGDREVVLDESTGDRLLVGLARSGEMENSVPTFVVTSAEEVNLGSAFFGMPPSDSEELTTTRSFAASELQPWGQYDTVSFIAPEHGEYIPTWKGLGFGSTSFDSTWDETAKAFIPGTPVLVTQTAAPEGYEGDHLFMRVVRSYVGPAVMATADALGTYQMAATEPDSSFGLDLNVTEIRAHVDEPRAIHLAINGQAHSGRYDTDSETELASLRVGNEETPPTSLEFPDLGIERLYLEAFAGGYVHLIPEEPDFNYYSFYWRKHVPLDDARGDPITVTLSPPTNLRANGEVTRGVGIVRGEEPLDLSWDKPSIGEPDAYEVVHLQETGGDTYPLWKGIYVTRRPGIAIPKALLGTGAMIFRIRALRSRDWSPESRPFRRKRESEVAEAVMRLVSE